MTSIEYICILLLKYSAQAIFAIRKGLDLRFLINIKLEGKVFLITTAEQEKAL